MITISATSTHSVRHDDKKKTVAPVFHLTAGVPGRTFFLNISIGWPGSLSDFSHGGELPPSLPQSDHPLSEDFRWQQHGPSTSSRSTFLSPSGRCRASW